MPSLHFLQPPCDSEIPRIDGHGTSGSFPLLHSLQLEHAITLSDPDVLFIMECCGSGNEQLGSSSPLHECNKTSACKRIKVFIP
jgi:ABC-type Fe3+-hydroxamate transport system substrate-binding protein